LFVQSGSGQYNSEFQSHPQPDVEHPEESPVLFPNGRPEVPPELSPLQTARLNDVLAYFHNQLGNVLEQAQENPDACQRSMLLSWGSWQQLLSLELDLAAYLKQLNNPAE